MDLQGKLLKFKDNKVRGTLESAQYILVYKQDRNLDKSAMISHAILSALTAEDEIILELNSSLFYASDKPKDELIYQCLETVKKMGLEHRYRKVPSSGNPSLFKKLLNNTTAYAHELIVQIAAENWKDERILSLILPYGARYYVTDKPFGNISLLDAFSNMTDKDKLDHFRLIIFDMGILGHMGINSASMEPGEVKRLLKI
jgi:hypothetical protein